MTLISSKHFHYSEFLQHICQKGRIASSLPSAKHPTTGKRQREWTVQSPSAAWPLKHGDAAKAILAELGVVLGILDILVAHPFLNHAQVDPVVYQPMAATMTQHMGVNRELEAGDLSGPANDGPESLNCELIARFGDEHVGRVRVGSIEFAQSSYLIPLEMVIAIDAAFYPQDLDHGVSSGEVNLVSF
jgi:hypothetical protein